MKMSCKIVSVALLTGLSTTALAANVTLYGKIDTGLAYTSVDGGSSLSSTYKKKSHNSFSMESGQSAGSRWGLKGIEELGGDWKVGFVLESGFNSDNGKSGQNGRLFGREANLFVTSDTFGTLSAGRVGILASDSGSYGLMGTVTVFGSGYGLVGNYEHVFAGKPARMDNTVTYVSPKFYGLQFSAQYAMGDTYENKSKDRRYMALGLSYQSGPVTGLLLVDYTNKGKEVEGVKHGKDQKTVTLGGAYDFGVAKVYAAGQYFDDANTVGGDIGDDYAVNLKNRKKMKETDGQPGDISGFGLMIGATVPVVGGEAMFNVGYADADSDKSNKKLKRFTLGAAYDYPLSKRTAVYAGAGFIHDKLDRTKAKTYQAIVGLRHSF
jgi:predicted porin